ncbi:MAG: DUF357 domain-containing protein [Candidatus Bathyarchaeota archaeon]|nr:DUF357 domain-containing protein [Candidatus Bathyarchaeota archaeon]
MNAQALSQKYIATMEKTVKDMQRKKGAITVIEACVDEILCYVTAYLEDAKYFWAQGKFETSLTSIAYCEGVLDALKLMGAVTVQPIKKQESL